jgi:hypothetical protein
MERTAYCAVNISPVRATHADPAEIVTQLLFGELVTVHEISEPWCRITTYTDNYTGWIDLKQIRFLSTKETKRWLDGISLETRLTRTIHTPWGEQLISRGAYVPYTSEGGFRIGEDHFAFTDDVPSPVFRTPEELALTYLNTPYLWGGKSPFGIDCSGLTQMVFRFFDINLPRDASQQIEHGRSIEFEELETGDAAFFVNPAGKVIHVGIVLPESRILHASGQVRIDSLTPRGIHNLEKDSFTHQLCGLRRF